MNTYSWMLFYAYLLGVILPLDAGTALRKPKNPDSIASDSVLCDVTEVSIVQENTQEPGLFYIWYTSMSLGYFDEKLDLFFEEHGTCVTAQDVIQTLKRMLTIGKVFAEKLFFGLMTNKYFLQNTQLFNDFCSYYIDKPSKHNFSEYIPQCGVHYLCDKAHFSKKRETFFADSEHFFIEWLNDAYYVPAQSNSRGATDYDHFLFNFKQHVEKVFYSMPHELKLHVAHYIVFMFFLADRFVTKMTQGTYSSHLSFDLVEKAYTMYQLFRQKKLDADGVLSKIFSHSQQAFLGLLYLEFSQDNFFSAASHAHKIHLMRYVCVDMTKEYLTFFSPCSIIDSLLDKGLRDFLTDNKEKQWLSIPFDDYVYSRIKNDIYFFRNSSLEYTYENFVIVIAHILKNKRAVYYFLKHGLLSDTLWEEVLKKIESYNFQNKSHHLCPKIYKALMLNYEKEVSDLLHMDKSILSEIDWQLFCLELPTALLSKFLLHFFYSKIYDKKLCKDIKPLCSHDTFTKVFSVLSACEWRKNLWNYAVSTTLSDVMIC